MITVKYYAVDNTAYIRLSSGKIIDSAEIEPNVVFDYDSDGHVVGIEWLDARTHLSAEFLNMQHEG